VPTLRKGTESARVVGSSFTFTLDEVVISAEGRTSANKRYDRAGRQPYHWAKHQELARCSGYPMAPEDWQVISPSACRHFWKVYMMARGPWSLVGTIRTKKQIGLERYDAEAVRHVQGLGRLAYDDEYYLDGGDPETRR